MAATDDLAILNAADVAQPLGRGAVAATAASVLFVISGYVINVTLGRALGPVDYGLFGVVIGLMTLINAVQTSGVPQAIAKFGAENRFSTADLFRTGGLLQVGAGLVLAIGLLVLAEPIATSLGDLALAQPLRLAAFAFPTYALLTLLTGIEGGRGRYVRQAVMLAVFYAAKAVVSVSLGLVFAVIGAVAGYVISPLIGAAAFGQRPPLRGGQLAPLRPIVAYSIPLIVLAVLSIAYLNVDLFTVKALASDPNSAGYYTAAQNVARVPYYLATGLAVILIPAVARVAKDQSGRASRVVRDSLRLALLMIVPVSVILVAQSQEIVELLFGSAYSSAVTPLRLLILAMGLFAFISLLTSVLAGIGMTWLAVLAALAGLVITTVLAIPFVRASGMDGAARSSLVGAVVTFVIAFVATYRALPFEVPWLTIARVSVASAVVGLICFALHGTLALLVGLPLVILVYLSLLVALREITADEWRRLRESKSVR